MTRVRSIFALILGVVFIVGALYANATMRADGHDPNPAVYLVGGFGLLLVLAVVVEAIEDGRR